MQPETEAAVRDVNSGVSAASDVAERYTAAGGIVAITAAAKNMETATYRARRIIIWTGAIIRIAVPVVAPFLHVARHIT